MIRGILLLHVYIYNILAGKGWDTQTLKEYRFINIFHPKNAIHPIRYDRFTFGLVGNKKEVSVKHSFLLKPCETYCIFVKINDASR